MGTRTNSGVLPLGELRKNLETRLKENNMAGKKNSQWLETMINKLGSREAVTKFQQEIGAKGGRNGNTGGFAANKELARRAGAIGGRISKRGKAKK